MRRILRTSPKVTVSQQVFYSQNYQPVYGVEIRNSEGKLRFGTALGAEEKAWLVTEVRDVLGRGDERRSDDPSGASVLEPMKVARAKEVFSVPVPPPGKSAIFGSLVFVAVGIGFMCIGVFLIKGEPFPDRSESEGLEYAFDLLFSLLSDGFRTVWILFSSVFAVIGTVVLISTLKRMGKDLRIEGNAAQISFEKLSAWASDGRSIISTSRGDGYPDIEKAVTATASR